MNFSFLKVEVKARLMGRLMRASFVNRSFLMVALSAIMLLGACEGCFTPVGVDGVLPPVIEDVPTLTNLRTISVNGTKQAGTALLLGGEEVVALGDETNFSVNVDLIEGGNILRFSCRDGTGVASNNVFVNLEADFTPPNPPILNPEPASFSEVAELLLVGTKDFASGVWLNGEQFTPIDDELEFSSIFDLEQGENLLRFTAKDLAGNESTVLEYRVVYSDVYFIVDDTPTLTANSELEVSGEAGEDVAVYLGDELLIQNGAIQSSWSTTISLSEGNNELIFEGRKEGSLPLQIIRSIELDTTPPAPPRLDPLPALTTSPVVILSGEKDVDSTVELDGAEAVALSSETVFSGISVTLSLGVNTLNVTSKDALGNESLPVDPPPTIVYDPSGVRITLNSVPNTVIESTLTLSGTRGADVDVYVDNILKSAADGTEDWSAEVELNSGLNTLVVKGKVGDTSSADLIVEVSFSDGLPSTPIVTAPTLTSDPTPLVSVRKDAGTGISVDGIEVYPLDSETEVVFAIGTLNEGSQDLIFTAFDDFRRVSDDAVVTIVLDTEGPILNVESPIVADLVSEELDIIGEALDENGVDEIRVKIGDSAEVTLAGTVTFNEVLSTLDVQNGTVVDVVVTAKDGAGAETTTTISVFIVHSAMALSGGSDFNKISQNSDIFVAENGMFYAVFEDDSKEADSDVYLTLFDGTEITRSENSILISDDNDNFATSLSPKVAEDGTGLVHIIFHDDAQQSGNSSLVHRIWDGTSLEPYSPTNMIVNGINGAVFTSDIDARAGYVVAVYSQNNSIYLSEFNTDVWSVPVLLDDAGAVEPISPRVQVGEDGIAHVVWADTSSLDGTADDPDIIYRSYDLENLILSDAILVSADDLNFVDGNSVAPDISLVPRDPNHLAYISWTETGPIEGSGNNMPKIAMRTVDDAAFDAFSIIGNTLNVSDVQDGSLVVNSAVSTNVIGDVSVAWVDTGNIDGSGPDTDVFVRRFTGVLEAGVVSISDRTQNIASNANSLSPRVGLDAVGNTHVVWTESSDVAGSIDSLSDQDVLYFGVAP